MANTGLCSDYSLGLCIILSISGSQKKTRMVPHQLSAEQHLETFLTLEELRVVSTLYILIYIYIQRQLLPEFIEEPEKCCAKKECSRLSTGILYTNNHPADFLTQWNFTTSRSK